jgi:hypothetical protein
MIRQRRNVVLPLAAVLLAGLALAQSGCGGGGPDRFDVSGRVTFNSQPVPFGQIIFSPDTAAGNSGPQGFAEIRDGSYNTRSGRSTVGGPHTVQIMGFATDPKSGNEDNPVPAMFSDYQTNVDLPKKTSTQDFEIPAQ